MTEASKCSHHLLHGGNFSYTSPDDAPFGYAGDVWAIDLPTHRDGVTLSEFLRRASQGDAEINRLPPVARGIIRLRLFLGRIFL